MSTSPITSLADLSVGDRVIFTSRKGARRGVRIDHIVGDLIASGQQFKLGEPNVLLVTRIMFGKSDVVRGRIELVAS